MRRRMRGLLRAPDHQIGQPGMVVDCVRALVQVEARFQRQQRGLVARAHLGIGVQDIAALGDGFGGKDAGFQRLADAFAGEGVGGTGRLAGDQQARARIARAFE